MPNCLKASLERSKCTDCLNFNPTYPNSNSTRASAGHADDVEGQLAYVW